MTYVIRWDNVTTKKDGTKAIHSSYYAGTLTIGNLLRMPTWAKLDKQTKRYRTMITAGRTMRRELGIQERRPDDALDRASYYYVEKLP